MLRPDSHSPAADHGGTHLDDGDGSRERAAIAGPAAIDEADFHVFYHREYRSVVGLGYVLTGSQDVAEDLAQEAFTAAHQRWNDISGYEKPEAWVRRVMINKSRSRLRRVVVEARALTRLGARRDDFDELPERSHEVWAAVRRLPRRQAQAVALRYWDDLGIEEIGDVLGCAPETVKTHLKRGRAALAKQLHVAGGDLDD